MHTSTSEVYGTAQYVPIDETPLQPQSPYSASKIGADAMALGLIIALSCHWPLQDPLSYGPRQSARA